MRDFYRIECEQTGLGPYSSGEYDAVLTPSSARHPTPWNEGLWDKFSVWDSDSDRDQRSFVCGFKSVDQLLAWFDVPSLKNMLHSSQRHNRNYNVIHFSSHEEHMRVGRCQAVARKSFLVEVSRQDLCEFINSVQIPAYTRELTYELERVKLGV